MDVATLIGNQMQRNSQGTRILPGLSASAAFTPKKPFERCPEA